MKLSAFSQSKIDHFQRLFGEAHLMFACEASVPLIFSTELLYKMWLNFNTYTFNSRTERIPHWAVSDLILSGFCQPVGFDLYKIETEIRLYLLQVLTQRLGDERQLQLAAFLQQFAEKYYAGSEKNIQEIHLLTAASILDPAAMEQKLSSQLAEKLEAGSKDVINLLTLYFNLAGEVGIGAGSENQITLVEENDPTIPGYLNIKLPGFLQKKVQQQPAPTGIFEPAQPAEKPSYAQALAIVEDCLLTGNSELQLGNCGLTDKDFEVGSPLDKAIRQCAHLQSLVLSNSWYDLNTLSGKKMLRLSSNRGGKNVLNKIPVSVGQLTSLSTFICGGEPGSIWGVKEVAILGQLTKLKCLLSPNNSIVDLTGIEKLQNLTELDLSNNQITDVTKLQSLLEVQQLDIRNNHIASLQPLLEIIQTATFSLNLDEEPDSYDKSGIFIHGNPLTDPGPDIIHQGTYSVIKYFEDKANNQTEYKNPTYEIFSVYISYARKDSDFRKRITQDLVARFPLINLHDDINIKPGENWIKTIGDWIESADYFIFVLTDSYVESAICFDEFQVAKLHEYKSRKSNIIPLKYDVTGADIPPIMQLYNYIDFSRDYRAGFERMVQEFSNRGTEKNVRDSKKIYFVFEQEDDVFCNELKKRFNASGFEVAGFEKMQQPNYSRNEQLMDLRESNLVVVIIGISSKLSKNSWNEFKHAEQQKKSIRIIVEDKRTIPEELMQYPAINAKDGLDFVVNYFVEKHPYLLDKPAKTTIQSDTTDASANWPNAEVKLEQIEKSNRVILWVDDNPDNNIDERERMAALNIHFELAQSTKEALEKMHTKKYDAIISDMGRVEGPQEGYVLLEAIRQRDQDTPYFIYAGSNLAAHKNEAKRLGAQGSTNSPVELINLVTQYLPGIPTASATTQLIPFKEKWVCVLGTGTKRMLKNKLLNLCRQIGKMLASQGYGLITGGWPGVDAEVYNAFKDELKHQGREERLAILQISTVGRDLAFRTPGIKMLKTDDDWSANMLKDAFAVIMIEGNGYTYEGYSRALAESIPVIPIWVTGGDAAKAFADPAFIRNAIFYQPGYLQNLTPDFENIEGAKRIGETVSQILSACESSPAVKPDKAFQERVRKLYVSRPIQFKDDLQKGRWGGASEQNGKQMTAIVTKLAIKQFDITVTITFEKDYRRENLQVAFFLHDSFGGKEIIFEKVINKKAWIDLNAYEAFTVGAYTEDGTMLELDLQTQPGFPEDFYYKDPQYDSQGFFTESGIDNIVREKITDTADFVDKHLMILRTPKQHTWLVTTSQRTYVLLDDENTRKEGRLIQTFFDKSKTLPVSIRAAAKFKGMRVVRFAAQDTWWYFSNDLYKTDNNLSEAIADLVKSINGNL